MRKEKNESFERHALYHKTYSFHVANENKKKYFMEHKYILHTFIYVIDMYYLELWNIAQQLNILSDVIYNCITLWKSRKTWIIQYKMSISILSQPFSTLSRFLFLSQLFTFLWKFDFLKFSVWKWQLKIYFHTIISRHGKFGKW